MGESSSTKAKENRWGYLDLVWFRKKRKHVSHWEQLWTKYMLVHYCCIKNLSKLQVQQCAIPWTHYLFNKRLSKHTVGRSSK